MGILFSQMFTLSNFREVTIILNLGNFISIDTPRFTQFLKDLSFLYLVDKMCCIFGKKWILVKIFLLGFNGVGRFRLDFSWGSWTDCPVSYNLLKPLFKKLIWIKCSLERLKWWWWLDSMPWAEGWVVWNVAACCYPCLLCHVMGCLERL